MTSEIVTLEAETGIRRSQVPSTVLRSFTPKEIAYREGLAVQITSLQAQYKEKLQEIQRNHSLFQASKEYKEVVGLTAHAKSSTTNSEGLSYSTSDWQKITQVRDTVQAHEKLVKGTNTAFDKKIEKIQGTLDHQLEYDERVRYIDYLKDQKELQLEARKQKTIPKFTVGPVPPSTVTLVTTTASIVTPRSHSPSGDNTTTVPSGTAPIPSTGEGLDELVEPPYPNNPHKQLDCMKLLRDVQYQQAILKGLAEEYLSLVVNFTETPNLPLLETVNICFGRYKHQEGIVKDLRHDYRLQYIEEISRLVPPLDYIDQERGLFRYIDLNPPNPPHPDSIHLSDEEEEAEEMTSKFVMKDLPRFCGNKGEDPTDHLRDFYTFISDVYKLQFETENPEHPLSAADWQMIIEKFGQSMKAAGWTWFEFTKFHKIKPDQCTKQMWEELEAEFEKNFNLIGTTRAEQYKALSNIKWIPAKQSLDEFITKFRRLMKTVKYDESAQICLFSLAMPQNMYSMVAAQHSLQKAIEAAKEGLAVFMPVTEYNTVAPDGTTLASPVTPFMPLVDPYRPQYRPTIDVSEMAQAIGEAINTSKFGSNQNQNQSYQGQGYQGQGYRGRGRGRGQDRGRGRGRGRGAPGRDSRFTCDFCGIPGHFLAQCRKLKQMCDNRGIKLTGPQYSSSRGRGRGSNPPPRQGPDQAAAVAEYPYDPEYQDPVRDFSHQNQHQSNQM